MAVRATSEYPPSRSCEIMAIMQLWKFKLDYLTLRYLDTCIKDMKDVRSGPLGYDLRYKVAPEITLLNQMRHVHSNWYLRGFSR